MRNRYLSIINKKCRRRQRMLILEKLETRACPTFSYSGLVGGAMTWQGTEGNDILMGIWAAGTPTTIWFATDPPSQYWPYNNSIYDTGVAAPITPTSAPIKIKIYGNGGNDQVDFWIGPAGSANMGGFPRGPAPGAPKVELLQFWGGEGNDTFKGPEPTAGPGTSPVILPAAGAIPNIQFFGGKGLDGLNNMDDPEFFDGDFGFDVASVGAGKGGGDDWLNGGLFWFTVNWRINKRGLVTDWGVGIGLAV
jgi:hypothetical protein